MLFLQGRITNSFLSFLYTVVMAGGYLWSGMAPLIMYAGLYKTAHVLDSFFFIITTTLS
jgi:hypothetical protein